jgi:hypothetical protein
MNQSINQSRLIAGNSQPRYPPSHFTSVTKCGRCLDARRRNILILYCSERSQQAAARPPAMVPAVGPRPARRLSCRTSARACRRRGILAGDRVNPAIHESAASSQSVSPYGAGPEARPGGHQRRASIGTEPLAPFRAIAIASRHAAGCGCEWRCAGPREVDAARRRRVRA